MVLQKGENILDRLCFGTYAKIIMTSIREPNDQIRVAELLLGLIIDNENITNQNGDPFVVTNKITSNLFNCKANLRKKIKEASSLPKIVDAAKDYFEDVLIPEIMPEMIHDLLAAMKKLISSDTTIPADKKKELLNSAEIKSLSIFLSDTLLYAMKRQNKFSQDSPPTLNANLPTVLRDAEKLKALIEQFSFTHPNLINPPKDIASHEMIYVRELLAAYADAEGLDELPKDSLPDYPKYKKDFGRRRKDYYAAESIRRGSRDIFGETDPDQFSVLKDETYDGIIDIYNNDFDHGLARLNSVMTQASIIRIDRCLFSRLPNWIGNREKKGVCHILVNDGRIKRWVDSDE